MRTFNKECRWLGDRVTQCLIREFFRDFLFEPLCFLGFFNRPQPRTLGGAGWKGLFPRFFNQATT